MKKMTVAFFDIDGTIHRDSLLIEHFKMLVKHEFIDMEKWTGELKKKYTEWDERNGDYDDYLMELVEHYVEALKNMNKTDMEFIAKRVIELKGNKVYRYTRKMLKYHKEKGHKVIVISGSPDFLVERMSQKYGADDFIGSGYLVNEENIFTGEVIPMWDSASKKKAINMFCKKYNIDLEKSYAYGDTTGDLTMFKLVGKPIAINPALKLLQKIRKDRNLADKIDIIVERKDIMYKLKSDVKIL